jgi:hypothetical protein
MIYYGICRDPGRWCNAVVKLPENMVRREQGKVGRASPMCAPTDFLSTPAFHLSSSTDV